MLDVVEIKVPSVVPLDLLDQLYQHDYAERVCRWKTTLPPIEKSAQDPKVGQPQDFLVPRKENKSKPFSTQQGRPPPVIS